MSAVLCGSPQVVPGCFHCGLPVPLETEGKSWQVLIDGVMRPMCCPGCQTVAQCIVDNGLCDFYSTRKWFSVTAAQETLIPPELQLYDDAHTSAVEQAGQTTTDPAMETCEAAFSIEGIRCAACVWLIERRLARLPGMCSINVNVSTECLHVRWNKTVCKPSDILKSLREIGYAAYPFDPVRHGEQLERTRKKLFRQLFIAGLSMMQVMMYALPVYLATDGTMDEAMTSLMRWAGLLLTLPAICYSAQPFFYGAWINLKHRWLGMDVPVSIGIVAAFGGSVMATLRGHGDVYFDSLTMFIFLLLCSRYLELMARRKAASALDNLHHALPASAWRMPGYPFCRDTELIPAAQLRADDVILIKPGDAIAADGVILEGTTTVDVSLLTGESQAQSKTIGANLPGGAINATQPIVMRVTHASADSTLSVLMQLIVRAGQGKPQLSLWADKVAAWFVGGLLLFAVVVFFLWQWIDPARAWPIAIAVLVVSCPCALSLATPTALAAATDRLVRRKILIVQPHVLETLHRATHIIFDKTGTLTVGKPVLQNIETLGIASPEWCLQVAAALEVFSAHPLAGAIVDAAKDRSRQQESDLSPLAASCVNDVREVAGQGLEGSVDGVLFRFGAAAFVEKLAGYSVTAQAAVGVTSIYLGSRANWLARFDVADGLRSDARQVVSHFRAAGKTVILLSGDQQAVARHVAEALGISTALGEYLPEQKLAYVQALQGDGAIVAMVGDGINDAAVLRAADVSFAMGNGAALAQMHADCVLLSGRLSSLSEVDATAAQTLSVIRQNLTWALLYNLVAIPAAALGLLNPWLSGIGMSVSSAVVVLNALRLRRIKHKSGDGIEAATGALVTSPSLRTSSM
ncbi:heavy metal translocating P-type ATPase [Glaciimonas sp. PCH181]|uniref:heavy metal translocating P-type ATPase n=1 Tax=Glaciimonas sp. PCH181 TaxID=2133943 RepID=UPI000D386DE1|nr:heavy metal translocating P-type ATPase [Glaciimonas sp. PCH181]PUA19463.1 heavy metal translocating P-type ATPase [Glaciimonas sp. PCH181]